MINNVENIFLKLSTEERIKVVRKNLGKSNIFRLALSLFRGHQREDQIIKNGYQENNNL